MKKILSLLDYFYYKTFRAFGVLGENTMSGTFLCYVLAIYILITKSFPPILLGILIIVFALIFPNCYLKNKRKAIISKYENESEEDSFTGGLLVFLYVLGSIVALVLSILLVRHLNAPPPPPPAIPPLNGH